MYALIFIHQYILYTCIYEYVLCMHVHTYKRYASEFASMQTCLRNFRLCYIACTHCCVSLLKTHQQAVTCTVYSYVSEGVCIPLLINQELSLS
jgi:hypothetical protein